MISDNIDCPYCHDVFDQYCNLFKGYKNCDKNDCEVLKILKENEQLRQQLEKMKCCANCKHALQGEYDDFENCSSCHATEVECSIKSPTKNSSGKYHDWDDKCDKWELAGKIQED